MRDFDFENLDVYQRALDFVERLFRISEKFPAEAQSSLGDQLRRAAISIINNIAEGSNKRTTKEKVQFYNYSLDSTRECVPILTICHRLRYLSGKLYTELREEDLIICKMLSKLIKAV